jgi:hypothetical protein
VSACRGSPAGARPSGTTPSGGEPIGPALCSDAVEPNARRVFGSDLRSDLGVAGGQTESLILAQNERWRRA